MERYLILRTVTASQVMPAMAMITIDYLTFLHPVFSRKHPQAYGVSASQERAVQTIKCFQPCRRPRRCIWKGGSQRRCCVPMLTTTCAATMSPQNLLTLWKTPLSQHSRSATFRHIYYRPQPHDRYASTTS